MLLQLQTVSRKTPNDGRLEITPETAARVTATGENPRVATLAGEAPGSVETLACTCGKAGGDGSHLHYFVESPILRDLTPGSEVRVELDGPGLLRITPAG